jgi:hypothetical protein
MRRLLFVAGIHFVLSWVVRYMVIAAFLANPEGWPGVALYWAWFFPIQSTAWLWDTGAAREDTTITCLLFALNSMCWATAVCAAWFCGSRLIGMVRHRMGGTSKAGSHDGR